MDCRDVRKSLAAFLESDLSDGDRIVVEAHLHHCEDCRREKLLLESAWGALDGFRAPAVGPDFTANLMSKIHEQEAKKPAWWGIALPEIHVPFGFPRLAPALVSVGLAAALCLSAPYFLPKKAPPAEELSVYQKAEIPAKKIAAAEPAPFAAKSPVPVPDEEIIRNLDAFENIDLLQNYALLKDFDTVQSLDVKVV
jgi:anti-sigma factor RsiW